MAGFIKNIRKVKQFLNRRRKIAIKCIGISRKTKRKLKLRQRGKGLNMIANERFSQNQPAINSKRSYRIVP